MRRNINGEREEALLPSVSSLNASHCTSAHDRSVFVRPLGLRESPQSSTWHAKTWDAVNQRPFPLLPMRELPWAHVWSTLCNVWSVGGNRAVRWPLLSCKSNQLTTSIFDVLCLAVFHVILILMMLLFKMSRRSSEGERLFCVLFDLINIISIIHHLVL